MIDKKEFHDLIPQKYWQPTSTWSAERKKQEFNNRVYSNEWFGSWKHDGAFYKLCKYEDGSIELLGRSKGVGGDFLDKHEWLPQLKDFYEWLPCGTCLLGEVYFPNNEGSKNVTSIMGCLLNKAIDRQNKGDKLHYYIFDCLAYNGESYLRAKASDRFECVNNIGINYKDEYVETATYYSGGEINTQLQTILAAGYEGMVLVKKDSIYEPDKRPSKTTMKCKKELNDTLDVFFTGRATAPTKEYTGKELDSWRYWYDERNEEKLEGDYYCDYANGKLYTPVTKSFFYDFAGSLEIGVLKDGKVHPIGFLSGLTEEIKAHYKDYKFKCIEVSAMEKDPDTGALRHGKMVGFRDDLTINDCTYEKYMG